MLKLDRMYCDCLIQFQIQKPIPLFNPFWSYTPLALKTYIILRTFLSVESKVSFNRSLLFEIS